MKLVRCLSAAAVLLLAGCAVAPQQPVSFAPKASASASEVVGIGMTAMPKVNTSFPGAGCLLCLAAAELANQSLTAHTQSLPSDDLAQVKDQAAAVLAKSGMKTKLVSEPLNFAELPDSSVQGANVARKDFTTLKGSLKVDKLLVIDITALGMIRTYSSYFPTSDPKAFVQGSGYLVNLSDNTYEWYAPIYINRSADGAWDEAPTFPGLTNAYYQAIEMAKDEVLRGLSPTSQALAPVAATTSTP